MDEHEQALKAIEEQPVTFISFVMDYVKIGFEGPILTALVWPIIDTKARTIQWREVGYRDALCELITKTVVEVNEEPEAICLKFEDNTRVSIPLVGSVTGGEVVILQNALERGDMYIWSDKS